MKSISRRQEDVIFNALGPRKWCVIAWCAYLNEERSKAMIKLDRVADWQKFSEQMEKHIAEYTIPQYQNEDNMTDQVGAWTADDCVENIKRYTNRFRKTFKTRGAREQLRDMLKIAHYAQFAYNKLKEEFEEGDVYGGE